MNIQVVYQETVITTYDLLTHLQKLSKQNAIERLLKYISENKIKMVKLITRVNKILSNINKYIEPTNELFQKPLLVFPEIDVSQIWEQCSDNDKTIIWFYLQILYVNSTILLKKQVDDQETFNKIRLYIAKTKKENPKLFNPMIGVTVDETFDINAYHKNMERLKDAKLSCDEKSEAGLLELLLGANMGNITEQFSHIAEIDDKELDSVIDTFIGTNLDPESSKHMKDIMRTVRDEIKQLPKSNGGTQDMIKTFTNVKAKIEKKLQDDKVDPDKFIENAQSALQKSMRTKPELAQLAGLLDPENMKPENLGNLMSQINGQISQLTKSHQIPPEMARLARQLNQQITNKQENEPKEETKEEEKIEPKEKEEPKEEHKEKKKHRRHRKHN